ncbi:hypothetical protein [Tautonia marina]|uniref:hypothetical protein n=1 Tax=Tautonia marina TaxID=2653855 RepID=UPI0012606A90|nr:hypothetical protein [Tautonia marina]
MNRSFLLMAIVLGLAGCGSEDGPITDPSQLPPLTEEQKQEIQENDAMVEEEERTGGGMITP